MKIYKIKTCDECPNNKKFQGIESSLSNCIYIICLVTGKVITKYDNDNWMKEPDFPDWCPLEDYKEVRTDG